MKQDFTTSRVYNLSGMFTLTLRLVVGWTYFSVFWRRIVLENRLVEDSPGYIGEQFNHFLPNALGIRPVIEYLVATPDMLWWSMLIFTIIEGIVGLLFMLGCFTRLASIGVIILAGGILLGSGWIGSVCLDEWQIGVLGIATGFTIFLAGGGHYSMDNLWISKNPGFSEWKWYSWVASGEFPLQGESLKKLVLIGSGVILFLTLFTNQMFHGGVFGELHNMSVKPKIEITDANLQDRRLQFTMSRVEGIDVYGSFLIGIALEDMEGNKILNLNMEDLAHFPTGNIHNKYVAKVKPGRHSMIIPLGAKATLSIESAGLINLSPGNYNLILTDISGMTWEQEIIKGYS